MNHDQLSQLSNYVKSKLDSFFDPAVQVFDNNLRESMSINHKGFYISVTDKDGKNIIRDGFLKENLTNAYDSANSTIFNIFNYIKSNNISRDQILQNNLHVTIIIDCSYIADPLNWDENKDGVYFQWGQRYKSLYLPHEINAMHVSKVETLDRLCAYGSGLPSSLWRLPEGLVFRLICLSS